MTPPEMTDDQSERPGDNLWGSRKVPHHEPLTPPHDSDPGEQENIRDSPPPEVQPQNGQHVTSPIVQKMQNSYDQAADQPLDFSLKREPAGCIYDHSNDSDERESNSSHSGSGDSRPESRASSGTPSPGEISREPRSVRTLGEGADLSDSRRGVASLNRSLSWVSRHAGHNGIPEVAYPNDSLSLPLGYICIPGYGDAGHSVGSDKQYKQYRAQLLKSRQDIGKKRNKKSLPEGELLPITDAVSAASLPSGTHGNKSEQPLSPGGSVASRSALVNPISSGRGVRRPSKTLSEDQKDDLYWERRRKNNEAAKRSRDARRAKEDEIAIKAALLEQENLRLKVEVAGLKNEINKLRYMLVDN